jgi:hypothetical protein
VKTARLDSSQCAPMPAPYPAAAAITGEAPKASAAMNKAMSSPSAPTLATR